MFGFGACMQKLLGANKQTNNWTHFWSNPLLLQPLDEYVVHYPEYKECVREKPLIDTKRTADSFSHFAPLRVLTGLLCYIYVVHECDFLTISHCLLA